MTEHRAPLPTFTPAQLVECDEGHKQPALGCPVCLLYLLYAQPLVDVGVEAVKISAEEGSGPARRMLADFNELRARVVARHLVLSELPAGGRPS
jgi:hypothetical protein